MKRGLVAIACVIAWRTAGGWAADGPPQYNFTHAAVNPSRTVVVGATLGSGWSAFPTTILTDLDPQMFYEELDVTMDLYVNWMLDTSDPTYNPGVPTSMPLPLRLFSWFSGHHSDFEAFVYQATEPPAEWQYKTCPLGQGLEAPMPGSFPLTADGRLHLADIHGGFGSWTILEFVDCRPTQDDPECGELYDIFVAWAPPGSHRTYYPDRPAEDHDYPFPGMYPWWDTLWHGENRFDIFFEAPVVHWVSSDIGEPRVNFVGPSSREVDEDDLAYYSARHGQTLRWGLSTENPPNSPTFQCDFAPYGEPQGNINASDLAMLAADMNEQCLLSKPGTGNEVAAMLEWFGIAATGRMVDVGPPGHSMLIPEYDIVDLERNRRAIADPSGFRRNLNSSPAKVAPWGFVKELYR